MTTELERLVRPTSFHAAAQCAEMGIGVGDTIEGRETYDDGHWSEARLTLLWIGEQVAVWMVWRRNSSTKPDWYCTGEQSNWTLQCRDWYMRPNT